jgi:hypothetical protein
MTVEELENVKGRAWEDVDVSLSLSLTVTFFRIEEMQEADLTPYSIDDCICCSIGGVWG